MIVNPSILAKMNLRLIEPEGGGCLGSILLIGALVRSEVGEDGAVGMGTTVTSLPLSSSPWRVIWGTDVGSGVGVDGIGIDGASVTVDSTDI